MWVRNVYQERKWKVEFHCLIKEMKLDDHPLFFTYFRMSPAKYEHLFAKVAPRLQKCSEKRDPICPSERLSVTLGYLFTGDAQKTSRCSSACYQCLVVGCMPLLFIIFQTVVLHAHVTQQSYLIGCSNHTTSFPHGKDRKS